MIEQSNDSGHTLRAGPSPSVEPQSVSPVPASVPDAVYSTFVIRHKNEKDAQRVFKAITSRWPLMSGRRSSVSAWAASDIMSVSDAVRMAMESRALDSLELKEFVFALLDCETWDGCLSVAEEWELEIIDDEFVDARPAKAMETRQGQDATQLGATHDSAASVGSLPETTPKDTLHDTP